MRSVIWPEFFHRIDYLIHALARNAYTREGGMADRAIERPFVFRYLPSAGRVLDIGCTGSDLPLVLSGLGYDVVGIDTRPYQMSDPPFTFVRGDIRRTQFPDGAFDILTAVSTVEHIGLSGRYGSDEDSGGDIEAMGEMHRICRAGGRVLLTVPFGRPAVLRPWNRVYGAAELRALVGRFRIDRGEFYAADGRGIYRRVDEDVASTYGAYANVRAGRLLDYSYALACLVLEKA